MSGHAMHHSRTQGRHEICQGDGTPRNTHGCHGDSELMVSPRQPRGRGPLCATIWWRLAKKSTTTCSDMRDARSIQKRLKARGISV
eukprot:1918262-Pyramimonas_sp.AAC.1